MTIATLYPNWWTVTSEGRSGMVSLEQDLRGRDLPAIGPLNYGSLSRYLGSNSTAAITIGVIAVAFCLATALAAYHRRMPFPLAALAGLSSCAFLLMAFILESDFPERARVLYTRGGGIPLAIIGGLLGAAGNAAFASWAWSPEARGRS